MRLSLRIQLTLAATVAGVVLLVGLTGPASVERAFLRYLEETELSRLQLAVPRLEAVYAQDGDFERLVEDPRLFGRLLSIDEPLGPRRRRQHPPPPPAHAPESLPARATLFDAARRPVVGTGALEACAAQLPLRVEDAVVGWLGVRSVDPFRGALAAAYLHEAQRQLSGVLLVAMLLGLGAGLVVTRRFLRPIARLSAGARRLAQGDYETRLALEGDDELGRLGRDFDALAEALAADERARRRWVADTSHELRTPVTVLRAELEALLDGVRPLERAAVESLHAEVTRLGQLVEDLGVLARLDRGEPTLSCERVRPLEVLEGVLGAFLPRFAAHGLSVSVERPTLDATAWADRLRLGQVFTNLLENSLRYTDRGGRLEVSCTVEGDEVVTRFDDTAPGVPAEALPRLAERFFRADPSRARVNGGAGLGLSICQRWVEAHGGRLVMSASPLGGLRVEVRLPRPRAEASP